MRSASFNLISGAARSTTRRQPAIPLLRIANMSSSNSKKTQGYGDPKGDPEADKPRIQQKPSNLKQTSMEHPGPEPVGAGKGKGGDGANVGKNYKSSPGTETSSEHGQGAYGESPTSSHPKDPGEASANSGGSRSKDAAEQHDRAAANKSPSELDEGGMSGGDGASMSGAPSSLKGGNKNSGDGSMAGRGGSKHETASSEGQQSVEEHNKQFEETGDRALKSDEERKGMQQEKGLDGPMNRKKAEKTSPSAGTGGAD